MIRLDNKELEKFLEYVLEKVKDCYKKEVEMAIKDFLKETAQEVPVQEQYVAKCKYCGKENKISLPKSLKPKFCMECGKAILYQNNQLL